MLEVVTSTFSPNKKGHELHKKLGKHVADDPKQTLLPGRNTNWVVKKLLVNFPTHRKLTKLDKSQPLLYRKFSSKTLTLCLVFGKFEKKHEGKKIIRQNRKKIIKKNRKEKKK